MLSYITSFFLPASCHVFYKYDNQHSIARRPSALASHLLCTQVCILKRARLCIPPPKVRSVGLTPATVRSRNTPTAPSASRSWAHTAIMVLYLRSSLAPTQHPTPLACQHPELCGPQDDSDDGHDTMGGRWGR